MSAERNIGSVRAVPAAPADVKADAVRRQPAQRVIERLHAHLLEFLELPKRRLRIDHVPVVRQARIVDLQHDAGIDDRLVLVAHRLGRGEQEFLLGLVIKIDAAGEAARADRAHEAFFGAARGERFFQVLDVGGERRMAGIFERPGAGRAADRPARRAAHQAAAQFRIEIELAEFLPVAAVGERGQRQIGDARFLMLGLVRCRGGTAGRRKTRHAREGVIPPRAVIVGTCHRFAELAVVRNIDAERALLLHHVGNRRRPAPARRRGRPPWSRRLRSICSTRSDWPAATSFRHGWSISDRRFVSPQPPPNASATHWPASCFAFAIMLI